MFYEACVHAGPDACALYKETADAVQSRTEKIFAALKERPIAVTAPSNTSSSHLEYGLVDYRMAKSTVFKFLYAPYSGTSLSVNSTVLAAALAAAEARDGRPLWAVNKGALVELNCECDKPSTPPARGGLETTLAIACSDGDIVSDSLDELQTHYEGMAEFSGFAELWNIRVSCSYVPPRCTRQRDG
jgi:hypothetical protein